MWASSFSSYINSNLYTTIDKIENYYTGFLKFDAMSVKSWRWLRTIARDIVRVVRKKLKQYSRLIVNRVLSYTRRSCSALKIHLLFLNCCYIRKSNLFSRKTRSPSHLMTVSCRRVENYSAALYGDWTTETTVTTASKRLQKCKFKSHRGIQFASNKGYYDRQEGPKLNKNSILSSIRRTWYIEWYAFSQHE